jgi:hypothetical protein
LTMLRGLGTLQGQVKSPTDFGDGSQLPQTLSRENNPTAPAFMAYLLP